VENFNNYILILADYEDKSPKNMNQIPNLKHFCRIAEIHEYEKAFWNHDDVCENIGFKNTSSAKKIIQKRRKSV